MQNTIYLTLGQSAKETGRSKSTIFKALESGKLSYVEKTTAGYKIDPAELFRVFPMGGTGNATTERSGIAVNATENDYLRRENELLIEQLKREREQIEREREQADYWRLQATNLLTHVPVEPAPEQKTESLLRKKLFGR